MGADRTGTITSLTYMVRSLLALPEGRRGGVVGHAAKPWCELLEQVTHAMRQDLRPVVVPLLAEICRQADGLTLAQRSLAGASARRVFAFAWGEAYRDRGMVRLGIEAVCRTYESDSAASEALLRQMLAPKHLAAHGYEELPTLAHELGRVLPLAPQLTEQVYRAAVAFREESDAPVQMHESRIMGLTSNRRQDYGLALHALGELFPRFMEVAPVQATGAVIAAVEAKVAEHATAPVDETAGEVFRLGEVEARIAEDLSYIWDAGHHHRYEIHLQMLDGFEEGLVRLAGSGTDEAALGQVLERVARENRFAAVWRRVLSAAAREPRTLGPRVLTLVCAVPLLVAADTLEPAGRFLTAIFPLLGPADREAVEQAILSIAADDPETAPSLTRRRDRLLGCLGAEHLVTGSARARLEELAATGGPPPNAPLFELGEPTWEGTSEAHWLAEQGVAVGAEPNRGVLALAEPVARFGEQFQHQGPTNEQAVAVLPSLRGLQELLSRGGGGADARVLESGWTRLAAACSAVARATWLEQAPEVAALVRSLLLELSCHDLPRPDADRDLFYEKHGAVSPSPRWHAAGGLLDLARFPSLADSDVLGAIRRLAQDPCAEIRGEVARNIHLLYRAAPDTFWELLRRLESVEDSQLVIRSALHAALPVARQHGEEMISLAHAVFRRFREDAGAAELRCACLGIVVTARARGGEPYGDELVDAVFGDLTRFVMEAVHLVRTAAEALTAGRTDRPDPVIDRLRAASFTLLERTARAILAWVRELESRLQGVSPSDWPAEARPQIKAIQQIVHELGLRVRLAAGSFSERAGGQKARGGPMMDAGRQRFLREAMPLLEFLADLAFPDVVHNLLETLEGLVSVDPRAVFLAVARAVRQGQLGGYQFESLGAGLVVRLVRGYLADYRPLFRDDQLCREALTEVLDTFVRAGWPEAMGLTYRLEEIFR
jgi:hypothetical protein